MQIEKKTIVLVKMNDITSEIVKDFLIRWGYSVVRIESSEALKLIIQNGKPSLIVFQFLEFSAQEFDLLSVIKREIPEIPVLATSPFISVKNTVKLLKAGATDYLAQPFDPRELKEGIEKTMKTIENE